MPSGNHTAFFRTDIKSCTMGTRHGQRLTCRVEEVVVLKLHGSIDWFDRRQYSASEKYRREEFDLAGEDHPVFKTSEPLRVMRACGRSAIL